VKEGAGTPGILRKEDSKIPGGNADSCENKGVDKIAIQKMLKRKE
jgi:hypothetical protein